MYDIHKATEADVLLTFRLEAEPAAAGAVLLPGVRHLAGNITNRFLDGRSKSTSHAHLAQRLCKNLSLECNTSVCI